MYSVLFDCVMLLCGFTVVFGLVTLIRAPFAKGTVCRSDGTIIPKREKLLRVGALALIPALVVGLLSYFAATFSVRDDGGTIVSFISSVRAAGVVEGYKDLPKLDRDKVHYCNSDSPSDKPYNFGPSGWTDEVNKSKEPEKLGFEDLKTRMAIDPLLCAGWARYIEVEDTSVSMLGNISGSTQEDIINNAHEKMRKEDGYWKAVYDKVVEYLEKCKLSESDKPGIHNAMAYMTPKSASFDKTAPSLQWRTSSVHDGHWLVFVKDGIVTLRGRYECGYQFEATFAFTGGNEPPEKPTPRGDPENPVNPNPPQPDPDPDPVKKPEQDPVNQGNAPTWGGENLPTDGAGEEQKTEPIWQDYVDRSKETKEETQPQEPGPDNDYGGTKDPTIGDPNAGKVDNGTPPATDPIPVVENTTVTDNTTGQTTPVVQEPVNDGAVEQPPV